jgi:hypothetical protein
MFTEIRATIPNPTALLTSAARASTLLKKAHMPIACKTGVVNSCAQSPQRDWSDGFDTQHSVSLARLASEIFLSSLQ